MLCYALHVRALSALSQRPPTGGPPGRGRWTPAPGSARWALSAKVPRALRERRCPAARQATRPHQTSPNKTFRNIPLFKKFRKPAPQTKHEPTKNNLGSPSSFRAGGATAARFQLFGVSQTSNYSHGLGCGRSGRAAQRRRALGLLGLHVALRLLKSCSRMHSLAP